VRRFVFSVRGKPLSGDDTGGLKGGGGSRKRIRTKSSEESHFVDRAVGRVHNLTRESGNKSTCEEGEGRGGRES